MSAAHDDDAPAPGSAESYLPMWQATAEGEMPRARVDGRYDTYPAGTIALICDRLRAGETLTRICRDPAMPDVATVSRWREADGTVALALREARRASAEALADRAIDAAEAATPETATAERLRGDAYRWAAARYRPDVYGDRTTHAHTGADGGAIEVRHTVVDDARAVAFLLARAQAVDAVQIEGSIPAPSADSES